MNAVAHQQQGLVDAGVTALDMTPDRSAWPLDEVNRVTLAE